MGMNTDEHVGCRSPPSLVWSFYIYLEMAILKNCCFSETGLRIKIQPSERIQSSC